VFFVVKEVNMRFFIKKVKKQQRKDTIFVCKCGNRRISNYYLGVEEKHFINCPKCVNK